MALEINGVVYTGMGTACCLHWHEVRDIYIGMGILDVFYFIRFRDIQTCMGNMEFRGLLHWHGLKGLSTWHGGQGMTLYEYHGYHGMSALSWAYQCKYSLPV